MHAQWVRQYTIAFDSHEGSELPSITEDVGTSVPKPKDPTRTGGYGFLGWFEDPAGGVAYPWPHDLTDDITMHAQWLPEVTIDITINDHDGGILDIDQTITISKTADVYDADFTATVNHEYSTLQWYLNGDPIDGDLGKADSIRVNAQKYQEGSYYLGVSVIKDGGVYYYSKNIYFTVTK
jgi:hypothetical protein